MAMVFKKAGGKNLRPLLFFLKKNVHGLKILTECIRFYTKNTMKNLLIPKHTEEFLHLRVSEKTFHIQKTAAKSVKGH